MEFLLTIQTCRGREQSLTDTMTSLAATDWPESPLVVPDTLNLPNRYESATGTAGRVLAAALERPGWRYLVYCEDDVAFNRHLFHNLCQWSPVKWGVCLVGTLYQGGEWPSGLAPCRDIGGSQAVVLRRDWVGELVRRWDELAPEGGQDLRFFRSVEGVFPFVFVHNPNLVQHRAGPSTWGGLPHASPNFDPEYRA